MAPPLLRKDESIGAGLSAGRWQVVQKIGDGGFAEVYEVMDTHNGNARVRFYQVLHEYRHIGFTPLVGHNKFDIERKARLQSFVKASVKEQNVWYWLGGVQL